MFLIKYKDGEVVTSIMTSWDSAPNREMASVALLCGNKSIELVNQDEYNYVKEAYVYPNGKTLVVSEYIIGLKDGKETIIKYEYASGRILKI